MDPCGSPKSQPRAEDKFWSTSKWGPGVLQQWMWKDLKHDINICVTSFTSHHRWEWAWSPSLQSKISSYFCSFSIYHITSKSQGHIYRIRTPKESTQRSQWIDNSPLNSSPSVNSARGKPLSQKPSTVYGRKNQYSFTVSLFFSLQSRVWHI